MAVENHGWAGVEFLKYVVSNPQINWRKKYNEVRNTSLFAHNESSGQVVRVGERLALVAFSGELATEAGITGWKKGDALQAVGNVFNSWKNEREHTGDSEIHDLMRTLRGFIERHGDSRFSDRADNLMMIRDRAGWYSNSNGQRIYMFTSEGMRDALKGFDYKRSVDDLCKNGVIIEKSRQTFVCQSNYRLHYVDPSKIM
jgi:putative DNA primase/helicase